MARVVYRDDNYQTFYVDVNEQQPEVTIGRNQGNMILIPAKSLSRYHAKIVYQNKRYFLVDLKSSNGSYVNNQRVANQEIHPGDKLRFGDVCVEFIDDQRTPAQPKAAPPQVNPPMGKFNAPKVQMFNPGVAPAAGPDLRSVNMRPITSQGNYRPTMPNQPTYDDDMAKMMAQQSGANPQQQRMQPQMQAPAAGMLDPAAPPMSFNPETMGMQQIPQNMGMPQMPQNMGMPQMPQNMGMPQMPQNMGMPQMPQNMGMPQMPQNMGMPQNIGMPQMPQNMGMPQRPQRAEQFPNQQAFNPNAQNGMLDPAAPPMSFDPETMGIQQNIQRQDQFQQFQQNQQAINPTNPNGLLDPAAPPASFNPETMGIMPGQFARQMPGMPSFGSTNAGYTPQTQNPPPEPATPDNCDPSAASNEAADSQQNLPEEQLEPTNVAHIKNIIPPQNEAVEDTSAPNAENAAPASEDQAQKEIAQASDEQAETAIAPQADENNSQDNSESVPEDNASVSPENDSEDESVDTPDAKPFRTRQRTVTRDHSDAHPATTRGVARHSARPNYIRAAETNTNTTPAASNASPASAATSGTQAAPHARARNMAQRQRFSYAHTAKPTEQPAEVQSADQIISADLAANPDAEEAQNIAQDLNLQNEDRPSECTEMPESSTANEVPSTDEPQPRTISYGEIQDSFEALAKASKEINEAPEEESHDTKDAEPQNIAQDIETEHPVDNRLPPVSDVNKMLEEAQASLASDEEMDNSQEKTLAQAQTQLQQSNDELTETKKQLEQLKSDLENHQKMLAIAQEQNQNNTQTIAELEEHIQQLQNNQEDEIARIRSEFDATFEENQKTIEQAQAEIKEHQSTIQTLNEKIDALATSSANAENFDNLKAKWLERFDALLQYSKAMERAVDNLGFEAVEPKSAEYIRSMTDMIRFCADDLK